VAVAAADERRLLDEAAARGVAVALLPADPLATQEVRPPAAPQRSAESVDPLVAGLLPLITPGALSQRIGELSGVYPAPVGMGSVTFYSRYLWGGQISSVEQYLYDYYNARGMAPRFVTWSYGSYSGRNVVVDIRGSVHPERIWLIGGHFDSNSNVPYSSAPGADDNASGIASTMLIADLLRSYQFADTVRFVHFSAEEEGEWGSKSYAASLKALGAQVMGYVDLDMIGWDGNGDRVVELHSGTGAASISLANAFISANSRYGQGLSIELKTSTASRFSDHSSFWDRGYGSFLAIENFYDDAIPRDRNPYYHNTGDILSRVNLDYTARYARAALAMIAEQAGIYSGAPATATPTFTATPTWTSTASPTATGTPAPTSTPTATGTATPTATPTVPGAATATPTPTATTVAACTDRVANGGFELTGSWTMPTTVTTAGYTTAQAHSGARSARFGLAPAAQAAAMGAGPERNVLGELAPLAASYSSGYQRIYIPSTADTVTLSFWYKPGSLAADGDFQRVLLLDPNTYGLVATLMKVRENNAAWQQKSFDLRAYRGRYIVIYFEVYNDNISSPARAWMYLDDVKVLACSAGRGGGPLVDPMVWVPLVLR
jgi:hypothetical protein